MTATQTFFVEKNIYNLLYCSNGCDSTELVALPHDKKGATAGCNFCGELEDGQDLTEAVGKWNSKQKE